MTVRALADLGQGARGRIVELRLPPGRRTVPGSPLQPGATVYVAEATGGRWLHVRIDYREYSIPLGVAEGVLIEVPEASQPPSAGDAYAVLVSRLDRRSWRVRVVDRASGVVVALKILHPHVSLSPGAVKRFLHEVRAYERLRHPNVISCLRGGRSGEYRAT